MLNLRDPLPSASEGLRDIYAWLSDSFPALQPLLASINTVLNTLIGMFITVAIIMFFIHLIRWIWSGGSVEREESAIRGATRSMIAIFLMINIWFIVRLVDNVIVLSPVIAYAVFFFSFFLLGFWSLFGAGAGFIRLISEATNWIVDICKAALRRYETRSPAAAKYLSRVGDKTLRVLVLGTLFLVVTGISLVEFPYTSSEVASQAESASASQADRQPVMYSDPLIREAGDSHITGDRYKNTRYGISIEYPDGWTISELPPDDHDGLIEAFNEELQMYSRLNAGIFLDLPERTHDSYLTALWRIERNIHGGFAADGEGILFAETATIDDISHSSTTQLRFISFWRLPDGSVATYYDFYYMLGLGPVYFTLQFNTRNEAFTAEEAIKIFTEIFESISITEPQLER